MTGEMTVGLDREPMPQVCEASLEAARGITTVLLSELGRQESVLYDVMNYRMARMPEEERMNIVPALLVDPGRSGVVVERWRQQSGSMPEDADGPDPDSMLALWSAKKKNIPGLQVPPGGEDDVMGLADTICMRGAAPVVELGGTPVVFERAEAAQVAVGPDTLIDIAAAANFANRERIKTALAVVEAHNYDKPLVATVDPLRVLRPAEREKVAEFAPDATNELELFTASAIAEGFQPDESNLQGSRYLPDGSTYMRMRHDNGTELIVLAPAKNQREDGSPQSGLFNAYKTLAEHGAGIAGINGQTDEEFKFAGSDVVYITSTHYGPPSVMNNLHAVYDLRTEIGSFQVVGDNQTARTPQSHLIEIGKTLGSIEDASAIPALRQGLLGEAA